MRWGDIARIQCEFGQPDIIINCVVKSRILACYYIGAVSGCFHICNAFAVSLWEDCVQRYDTLNLACGSDFNEASEPICEAGKYVSSVPSLADDACTVNGVIIQRLVPEQVALAVGFNQQHRRRRIVGKRVGADEEVSSVAG